MGCQVVQYKVVLYDQRMWYPWYWNNVDKRSNKERRG